MNGWIVVMDDSDCSEHVWECCTGLNCICIRLVSIMHSCAWELWIWEWYVARGNVVAVDCLTATLKNGREIQFGNKMWYSRS